jgi:uncharacterized membrane protein
MATRQAGGKSGKRGTASAGRKSGGGTASLAKPARGGSGRSGSGGSGAARQAAGAKGGTPASKAAGSGGAKSAQSRAGRPGGPSAAAGSPAESRRLGGPGAAWDAIVRRSGGGVPFWTMVVSLLGLMDAAYLTYEHFTASTTLACPENATLNCLKVTTSPESRVFGIPVAVLGLAFFVFMVVVNSRWGWKAPWSTVHWARLASVVVGIVFVLYLIWAELFRINAICLFCTGVHILTFILFALIVGRAAYSGVKAMPDKD